MDSDTLRIWSLILELADQLSNNKTIVASLQKQAEELKERATEAGSLYRIRRFSVDITKEIFESEVERTSAAIVLENHALLYDNRQLSTLLKEYEDTLQTVMGKFRNLASSSAQYEVALKQHYESLLAAQESASYLQDDGPSQANFKQSVAHLTHLLKKTVRLMSDPSSSNDDANNISPMEELTLEETLSEFNALSNENDEGGVGDWAEEREHEISRLDKENGELRKLLGIHPDTLGYPLPEDKKLAYPSGRALSHLDAEFRAKLKKPHSSGITSPGSQFGHGMGGAGGVGGTRYASPPVQLKLESPTAGNNINMGSPNVVGFSPLTLRPSQRKPPVWGGGGERGGAGSPLGLYRNVSLPPVGNGNGNSPISDEELLATDGMIGDELGGPGPGEPFNSLL